MNRRKMLLTALSSASAVFLSAAPQKEKHDRDDDEDKGGRGRGRGRGRGQAQSAQSAPNQGYFREEYAEDLRRHYNGERDLPPGLRKKYYRTGTLPPGWEKRIRPFPPALIQRLPPPPPNCERGYLDGYAVVYDRRTRVIVDVLDILNATIRR